MPPLVVMTLLALLAAVPLMIASDLLMAASTARTVITGLSNVYLGLAATDYFAPGVKENIFLHTWYIAVLIQVLIAAPFLCRLLSRFRLVWQYLILALIALVSLLIYLQHWLPREYQNYFPSLLKDGGRLGSVYYMTTGRLWEVIAGAFIALLPKPSKRSLRTLLQSLGLLLLIIPCFWPENLTGFALSAAIGTLLIIRYGEDTHLTPLFENKAIMWLGTVSFTLYLIHWPTMALARYALMHDFSPIDCTWVTLLSLLLTWALYKGVEKRRPHLLLLALLWALTMALSLVIRKTDGLKNYVHVEVNAMREYTSTDYKGWEFAPESSWVGPYPKELNPVGGHYGDTVLDPKSPDFGRAPVLQIGDKTKQPNFILLGDSYANALFPGFDIIGREKGWSGLFINFYMTPFWGRLNTENGIKACHFSEPKARALLDWLARNPHIRFIVVYQQWHWRFNAAETWDGTCIPKENAWKVGQNFLALFCKHMKDIGKEVIFVMPTPESKVHTNFQIARLIKRTRLWYHSGKEQPHVQSTRDDYEQRNARICETLRRQEKANLCTLIDPLPIFFNRDVFDPIEGDDLIVCDHGHMTVYGAEKLIRALQVQLNSLLSSDANNVK